MSIDVVRRSQSEAETALVGRALAGVLRGGDVVLLEGQLGAGKTTLTRSIAQGMGVDEAASPTFVMVHEYGSRGGGPSLIHVDAYRLGGDEELETLGWDRVMDEVRGGRAVLLVEWASRIAGALEGLGAARIELEHAGEHERVIRMTLPDAWAGREGVTALAARRATVCPITGAAVPADSPTYPFASERARLADLHRWFAGNYTISREVEERDVEEGTGTG